MRNQVLFNTPLDPYNSCGNNVFGEPHYYLSARRFQPDQVLSNENARAQKAAAALIEDVTTLTQELRAKDQTEHDYNKDIDQIVFEAPELSGTLLHHDGYEGMKAESSGKVFRHLVHPERSEPKGSTSVTERIKNWLTEQPESPFSEEYLVYDEGAKSGTSVQIFRATGEWLVTDIEKNTSWGDADDWFGPI